MTGIVECKHDVDMDELDIAREMCCADFSMCSSPEFNELAELIMTEQGMGMPENGNEASNLYLTLISEIDKIM